MNNPHQNARLTVYSRVQIVARIGAGQSAAEVAAAFGVSVRTVRKWVARFRAGGRAALCNRASAPARRPRRLPDRVVAVIVWMRRQLRLTASAIAARLGLARSTVARWLTRAGLGRLKALDPPEPVRRYQREQPGELIHLDIKKLGRFDRPGHRVTGTRRGCRNRGAGWDFVHVAVDDGEGARAIDPSATPNGLAHVEVLPDERKDTTTAFLMRALRWFRRHGIRVEARIPRTPKAGCSIRMTSLDLCHLLELTVARASLASITTKVARPNSSFDARLTGIGTITTKSGLMAGSKTRKLNAQTAPSAASVSARSARHPRRRTGSARRAATTITPRAAANAMWTATPTDTAPARPSPTASATPRATGAALT